MSKAIIATHGELGRSLLDTVKKITGDVSGVCFISNENRSMKELVAEIDKTIKDLGEEELILFLDFVGGSPWNAAKFLKNQHKNITLISGVNLPMLLSYFNKREATSFADLAEIIQDSSKRGIVIL